MSRCDPTGSSTRTTGTGTGTDGERVVRGREADMVDVWGAAS
ncbi:hypothetical protein [Streptomyces sp. CoH17]|nr:hypothetical protein [Streptomyces sp. CoH17]